MRLQQLKVTYNQKAKMLSLSKILNYNSLIAQILNTYTGLPPQFELHYRPLPEKPDAPMFPLLGQTQFENMAYNHERAKIYIGEDLNASRVSMASSPSYDFESNTEQLNNSSKSILVEVQHQTDYRHSLRKFIDPQYQQVAGESPLKEEDILQRTEAFRQEMRSWQEDFQKKVLSNVSGWHKEFNSMKE